MKKTILCLCLVLTTLVSQGQQVTNYDSAGNPDKSISDFLQISFEKKGTGVSASAGITGVIAPIVGLAVDFINAKVAKSKLKYSATYSNQITIRLGKIDYSKLSDADMELHLKRYKMNTLDDEMDDNHLMADYAFGIKSFDENSIQLHLNSVKLIKSKARVKNSNDNLTVSIDLTISTSTAVVAKDTGKNKSTSNEAIVKIPIIKPGTTISKPYATITDALFPGIPKPDTYMLLTIAATVTEVNTDRLDPNTVENILKNNATDINAVLKAIFPGADK